MKIVAVDEESLCLDVLCALLQEIIPEVRVSRFMSAQEAFEYLSMGAKCDVLFLDPATENRAGLKLAHRVQNSRPEINLIFTAYTEEFAMEALQTHASGYLLKPISAGALKRELGDLRHEPGTVRGSGKRVRAQCFGNFELFVDGHAVKFKYRKTRELAAFLIDRCGAVCTGAEIMATLWEEDMKEHPEYLKSLIRDLTGTLKSLGCENILEKQWGGIGIRPDMIDCDFYNWKRGNTEGLNNYRGEYMSQYSWGEFTNAAQFSSSQEL